MEKKDLEFIKIALGLRKEYLKNKERLEELKKLIVVNEDKFKEYYFYVLRRNDAINVCLHLMKNDLTFIDYVKKVFNKKDNESNLVLIDSNGKYSINSVEDIAIKDQAKFNYLVGELERDAYLNSNFNNVTKIDNSGIFRISVNGIRYDDINSNDPKSIRYVALEDLISCAYYYPLYEPMSGKHALPLLNYKLDRDNVPVSKLEVIESNPIINKDIVFDENVRFDILPDKIARLNLGIQEEDNSVKLTKI